MRRSSPWDLGRIVLAAVLIVAMAPPPLWAATAGRHTPRADLAYALSGIDDAVAAEVLWRLGGPDAPRHLAAIVRDGAVNGAIRLRAVAALHTLGDAAALRACTALAADARLHPRLRWHAAYGAVVLGSRLDAALALRLATRWVKPNRSGAAPGRHGAASGSASSDVAEAAVRGLRHLPGMAARRLLLAARGDPRRSVRDAAHAVLARRQGR